jgi:hypothetical protein
MPPQVHETKHECQIDLEDGTIDGLIHLIEVVYDDTITFWNAVIQVPVRSLGDIARIVEGKRVGIRLADDRSGDLNISQAEFSMDYLQIVGSISASWHLPEE